MGAIFMLVLLSLATFVGYKFSQGMDETRYGRTKGLVKALSLGVGGLAIAVTFISNVWFYADPGYNYHIRNILGHESVSTTVGWKMHLFGTYTPWKKAASVITSNTQTSDDGSFKREGLNVTMLDKVDGKLETSVRFRISDDPATFLKMAQEYRTPENLLHTELIPAIDRTMKTTAQLMSAEDYFNGGVPTFAADFDEQMRTGIYQVQREEVQVPILETSKQRATADSARRKDQEDYGAKADEYKVIFRVSKILDKNGQPLKLHHTFEKFGITVETAIVTDFEPNPQFRKRLQSIQEASAARQQAREKKIQEEEQKQYVIAAGERAQAEAQQENLKEQIAKTTAAETAKALALIEASRAEEQAKIDERAAAIKVRVANLDAQAIKVRADAEAYQKQKSIKADDGLATKLEAAVKIHQTWAAASATRPVPQSVTIMGGGASAAGVPTGNQADMANLMNVMTLMLAKDLQVNTKVDNKGNPAKDE
jgi:hypothetical protein